jgi:hypothetical protein
MKSFSFGGAKRKSTVGEPSPVGSVASNASSTSKPGAAPAAAAANPFSENGNPFTMDEEESTPSPPPVKSNPPPPPPASAPPSGPPKVMVEALYDHDVSLLLLYFGLLSISFIVCLVGGS